jgi:hypothetical protein
VTPILRLPILTIDQPILSLPRAPRLLSLLAKALTFFIPISALAFLIRTFMHFPSDAAHVTASFVKSRQGVHQALHMAHDEMQTITTDRWDDEIWGATQKSKHTHARPVLRFLFAKEDHWYVFPISCAFSFSRLLRRV